LEVSLIIAIFRKRNDETTIENISKPLGKPGKGFVYYQHAEGRLLHAVSFLRKVDSNLLYKKNKTLFFSTISNLLFIFV
jgi:hypothetical protein